MRFLILLLACSMLFTATPATAQDDDGSSMNNGLLDLLAVIPDSPSSVSSMLSYVDYRALEMTRAGAARPSSWAEWDRLSDANDDSIEHWMAAFMGLSSGPSELAQTFVLAEKWPSLVGFDFFDIDRAIEYGMPPSQVQVLSGEFDSEAITAAFTARDYTAEPQGELTLLCSAAGCDQGQSIDFNYRNPEVPFGGRLGRREVMLVADDLLVNSPDHQMIEAHIDALEGTADTLAENIDFRAAAEAAAHEGALIQATIVSAAEFGPQMLIDRRLSAEQVEAIMERLARDFVAIPQFNLVVIADAATDTEQIATVGLVYVRREDAEAAAAAIPQRIAAYTSMATQRSLSELLLDRGASVSTEVMESASGESAMTLIVFRAPLPGDQRSEGRLLPSSLIYRLLVQMLVQRDIGWLTPSLPE